MINKLLIVGLIVGLICMIVIGIVVIYNYNDNEKIIGDNIYQGPVPQGYDLKHFRETGETILEVEE